MAEQRTEDRSNPSMEQILADRAELLAMLRELEWWPDPEGFLWCMSCRRMKAGAEHAPGCRLAALLARFAK